MKDWVKFLTNFLQLSNYPILKDKGKVTILEAKLKAEGEFEKFRVIQDREYESDFDKAVKQISPPSSKPKKKLTAQKPTLKGVGECLLMRRSLQETKPV